MPCECSWEAEVKARVLGYLLLLKSAQHCYFLLIHDPHRSSEAFLLYPCCRDLIGSCIVLVESTLLPCSSEKHALHVGHLAIDGCPPRNVIIRSDQECFATLDLMSMLFLGQIHDLQGDVEDGRPCCELLRNVAVR
jgi:hypothetical protein